MNSFYSFTNPCQSTVVKNVLEAGQQIAAQPKVKKESITPDMMLAFCSKFASATANLAYAAFLRFDE